MRNIAVADEYMSKCAITRATFWCFPQQFETFLLSQTSPYVLMEDSATSGGGGDLYAQLDKRHKEKKKFDKVENEDVYAPVYAQVSKKK